MEKKKLILRNLHCCWEKVGIKKKYIEKNKTYVDKN